MTHLSRRLNARYGVRVDEQGAAELRNLIKKRRNPKRAGKQVFIGAATAGRELWDVWFRSQWLRVVYDPVAETVVTALPREYVARRAPPAGEERSEP